MVTSEVFQPAALGGGAGVAGSTGGVLSSSTVTVTGEASTTVPITTALAALVNPPSAGCVMVSCGGMVSTTRLAVAVLGLPARSLMPAVITCGPSLSAAAGAPLAPVAVAVNSE